MTEYLPGRDFIVVLSKALNLNEPTVKRIIIDADFNSVVAVYVEYIGDKRLFEIDWPGHLKEAQIKQVDKDKPTTGVKSGE